MADAIIPISTSSFFEKSISIWNFTKVELVNSRYSWNTAYFLDMNSSVPSSYPVIMVFNMYELTSMYGVTFNTSIYYDNKNEWPGCVTFRFYGILILTSDYQLIDPYSNQVLATSQKYLGTASQIYDSGTIDFTWDIDRSFKTGLVYQ